MLLQILRSIVGGALVIEQDNVELTKLGHLLGGYQCAG